MSEMSPSGKRKEPLYLQLYKDLLEKIRSGEYPPGSKLPSEKELGSVYNVSRITSKKAMDALVANGFITRTPGRGTFVLKRGDNVRSSLAEVGGKEQRLIGVVIEKIAPSFGGELLLGLERACAEMGYFMVLRCTHHSKLKEEAAILELLDLGVKGLVILCVYDETYNPLVLKLALEEFPLMLIDRELNGISLPCVSTDNISAAQQLTDAVFDQGHRQLTFVTAGDAFLTSTIEDRAKGFIKSCMSHGAIVNRENWAVGVRFADSILTSEQSLAQQDENVRYLINYFLNNPQITGFVAASYTLAVLVQLANDQCPVIRGQKRCVACFDAPEDIYTTEPLLHVIQDQVSIGETAIKLLIKRIKGEYVPRQTYIPFRMVK